MFTIFLCVILGFLIGLGIVMYQRRMRPANVFTATLLAFLSSRLWRIIRDYFIRRWGRWY